MVPTTPFTRLPRRRRLLRCVAVALCMAAALANSALAKDRITWGVPHAAPNQIVDGPDKGQGIRDQIQLLLQERLVRFDHQTVVATFPRIQNEMRKGDLWCFVGSPRSAALEEFAVFSIPAQLSLPRRIIVRKKDLPRFSAFGELSLDALLANGSMQTSFGRGVAFGPAIEALLARYQPPSHADDTDALRMLLAGRIDYLYVYPVFATYTARKLGHDGELVGLPFAEMTEAVLGRVMCADTAPGRQVIGDVNAILREERPKARYRKIMELWQDDEGVREIRRLYDTKFLSAE
ncbi:ABC transporter substrate-binding protein [Ideonella sp. BN130291]|uniref:ABC transporter substrate-binding protein n=1 Tax=Ideonella sp. BN130291 TaxID=3112940 RepID=UPI002E273A2E|nr:ABC transporter substrate-binding protein [Ideonella sp. BN130291]